MILGLFDLLAGFVFKFGNTWIAGGIATFIFVFLVFKGVTTMIRFPIWFGPLSFFAGIVDLVTGLSLYFTHGYTGALVTVATVLGVFLTLKGAFTVVFGLFAS